MKVLLEIAGEDEVHKLFSFSCEKDFDIEHFLKEKAIEFEKTGKSRTYFIFDEEAEEFRILAYYTIALSVLNIPEEFSNRQIRNFDGLYSKARGKRILHFPAILIGQLGKNDQYKAEIKGEEIMQFCLSTVMDGQNKLSGRIVMLECRNIPYLFSLYEKFGFRKIEKKYEPDELFQFVRILREDEIINHSLSIA
ncbi:MAG: hypothetical protein WDA65_02720 [Christensenellales bacterium]